MTITDLLGRLAAGPALSHPPLWLDLAWHYPWLLTVTNGVRLVATVLALTIVARWAPALWCVLTGRHGEGSGQRASWWPMAVAVVIFNARWFTPALSDLVRGRMALIAQVAVMISLAFALYAHGRDRDDLSLRRALLIYLAMLAIGVGVSAVLR